MVTHLLTRDIRQSGLFKAVFSYDSGFPCSFVLKGSVDDFFEWDLEKSWKAILSVSITLVAKDEPDIAKKILFQKTYSAEHTCRQKNPRGLAEAMSQGLADVSGKIIRDIYCCLSDY